LQMITARFPPRKGKRRAQSGRKTPCEKVCFLLQRGENVEDLVEAVANGKIGEKLLGFCEVLLAAAREDEDRLAANVARARRITPAVAHDEDLAGLEAELLRRIEHHAAFGLAAVATVAVIVRTDLADLRAVARKFRHKIVVASRAARDRGLVGNHAHGVAKLLESGKGILHARKLHKARGESFVKRLAKRAVAVKKNTFYHKNLLRTGHPSFFEFL